jgi:hypothetical protein
MVGRHRPNLAIPLAVEKMGRTGSPASQSLQQFKPNFEQFWILRKSLQAAL